MGERLLHRYAMMCAATVTLFAGLVAACSAGPPEAAPVELTGAELGVPNNAPSPIVGGPRAETRRIVVQPGQSVGKLAVAYHVSKQAIIAANHLTPPYKIEIGKPLIIPGGAEPVRQIAA